MVYPFNSDHEMIREVLSGFLQDWYENGKGPERIYKSGKAFDREAWSGFSHDLGMVGVAEKKKNVLILLMQIQLILF